MWEFTAIKSRINQCADIEHAMSVNNETSVGRDTALEILEENRRIIISALLHADERVIKI